MRDANLRDRDCRQVGYNCGSQSFDDQRVCCWMIHHPMWLTVADQIMIEMADHAIVEKLGFVHHKSENRDGYTWDDDLSLGE